MEYIHDEQILVCCLQFVKWMQKHACTAIDMCFIKLLYLVQSIVSYYFSMVLDCLFAFRPLTSRLQLLGKLSSIDP
jgi:hypothetical protein